MNIIYTLDKRLEVIKNYLNASFVYELKDINNFDLLLPIKGIDELGNILDTDLNIIDILNLGCVKRIFNFKKSDFLINVCFEKNVELINLFDFSDLLKENSYLTAEGLLGIIINKTNKSLKDSRVLLLGYGNCGKEIYKLFKNITSVEINDLANIEKYDIIINTIPKLILDKALLKRINGVIFDISSYPHGLDIEYAMELKKEFYIELAIPSRFSYETSGKMVAKKILEICSN